MLKIIPCENGCGRQAIRPSILVVHIHMLKGDWLLKYFDELRMGCEQSTCATCARCLCGAQNLPEKDIAPRSRGCKRDGDVEFWARERGSRVARIRSYKLYLLRTSRRPRAIHTDILNTSVSALTLDRGAGSATFREDVLTVSFSCIQSTLTACDPCAHRGRVTHRGREGCTEAPLLEASALDVANRLRSRTRLIHRVCSGRPQCGAAARVGRWGRV